MCPPRYDSAERVSMTSTLSSSCWFLKSARLMRGTDDESWAAAGNVPAITISATRAARRGVDFMDRALLGQWAARSRFPILRRGRARRGGHLDGRRPQRGKVAAAVDQDRLRRLRVQRLREEAALRFRAAQGLQARALRLRLHARGRDGKGQG